MAEQNKTEKATPRRRQKAREQGQVARSRDLVAGVGTMAAVLLLSWQLRAFAGDWRALLRGELEDAAAQGEQLVPAWRDHLDVFRGVLLAAGLSWLLATASGLAQGGLVIAPTALVPNLNRLNPGSKLGQLFSLSALSRLLKSLLPAALIVYFGVAVVARDWFLLPALLHSRASGVIAFAGSHVLEVAWKASLALLAWSAADYLLERQRHENELKMSRQDLRDEFKETEGNPAVKQRIRRLQRQARRRRMLQDVERAAVVVTNPTEFAIALEYRVDMDAPVVVAKGRDLLAAQIKEVARWHGIPLVENPPLAHALYRAVEVGQAIPPQLYTVVAEILAAIWRAQARAGQTTGQTVGQTVGQAVGQAAAPSARAAAPGRV
jgi:flagellar biosynthetic protein FlhB